MRTTTAAVILAMLILLVEQGVQAKSIRATGDQFTMDINISGTVVANGSCTFTNGRESDVNFGDVRYHTTAGGNVLESTYSKTLVSDMTCTGDTAGTATMILSSANQENVDYEGHKLLGTSVNGIASKDLAIQLVVDDVVQDVNSAFTVDLGKPPKLVAKLLLVGDGGSLTDDTSISSSATLTMAFE